MRTALVTVDRDPAPVRGAERLLVVNADDLGLSEDIDGGILRAFDAGIVTAASLAAGGASFAAAAAAARARPALDLGAHLTLVGERPVLDPARVPSLVGPDGRFPPDAAAFTARWLAGRLRPAEIRVELAAQLARIAEAGLRVSHLDSHQHLHVLPGLAGLVGDLAQAAGISYLRLPLEGGRPRGSAGGGRWRRRLEARVLGACAVLAGRGWRRRGLRHPAAFLGFGAGGRLDRPALLGLLDDVGEGVTELMCHPGLGEAPLPEHAAWGYRWRDELAALTDPDVRRRVSERGIRLVGFGELAG